MTPASGSTLPLMSGTVTVPLIEALATPPGLKAAVTGVMLDVLTPLIAETPTLTERPAGAIATSLPLSVMVPVVDPFGMKIDSPLVT